MSTAEKPSTKERIREELYKYGIISAYLFISFLAILMYDEAAGGATSTTPLPIGLALVKALVLGKFILIGQAIKVGASADKHPLLHRVAWKSLAMLALLVVFKVIEEIIVGWFHDLSIAQVYAEFMQRSWLENVAPLLLMFLILVPLVTASEVYRLVGGERFRAYLTNRPQNSEPPGR